MGVAKTYYYPLLKKDFSKENTGIFLLTFVNIDCWDLDLDSSDPNSLMFWCKIISSKVGAPILFAKTRYADVLYNLYLTLYIIRVSLQLVLNSY